MPWSSRPITGPSAVRDAGAQRDQRVHETEIVERLRAQLARDPTYLVEAFADRMGDDGPERLRGLLGVPFGGSLCLDRHRGERLPDFVVQLARHPQALRLLGGERRPRGVVAGALQPVEHPVERVDERLALGAPGSTEDSRSPGASGSTELITSVSVSSGASTRRSRNRFITTSTTKPASSSRNWLNLIGKLTSIGLNVSSRSAITKTATFARNTRHRSEIGRLCL